MQAAAKPSAALIKMDEKKGKMQVKEPKKECKYEAAKFQGPPKSIKIDEATRRAGAVCVDSFHVDGPGHGLMVSKCLSSEEMTRLNPPGSDECKKRPIANVVRAVDDLCHFIKLDHRDATYRRHVATNPSHSQLTLLSLATLS
ncbi:hypothetical protein BYT27DRAFT_7334080 [Phlegmacium glaucopus]|nr:hypothetical protein BYT27DRAFT_7334080 [Phlegmacium glaucopus]